MLLSIPQWLPSDHSENKVYIIAHKCPAPSYFSDLISDSIPFPLALSPQATGLPDLLPQNQAAPPSGLSP